MINKAKNIVAFTLIEISIVLVIIGLIVAGVLVGRDLISSAEIRQQITQIEKLNIATNTFRGKFGALPGDMAVATATQFGFGNSNCAGTEGHRNGNGMVEGDGGSGSLMQGGAETGLFWNDLSSSVAGNLIEGSFTTSTCTSTPTLTVGRGAADEMLPYAPRSKIANYMFILVYNYNRVNYFGLNGYNELENGVFSGMGGLTTYVAHSIDKKVDDGFPSSGRVKNEQINGQSSVGGIYWAAVTWRCYDSSTNTYNISYENGSSAWCPLSFVIQ